MTRDYKDSRVQEPPAPAWRFVIGIVALIALLGWMDNRDREHQEEVDYLATVVHSQAMEILRMTQSECAPVMEMDMPIDMGRVQL